MSLLNQESPPPIVSTIFIGLFSLIGLSVFLIYNSKKTIDDFESISGVVELHIAYCDVSIGSYCKNKSLIKFENNDYFFVIPFNENDTIIPVYKGDSIDLYFDLNPFNENQIYISTTQVIKKDSKIIYQSNFNYSLWGYITIVLSILILLISIYLYNKKLIS
jgi:hypothetical protein